MSKVLITGSLGLVGSACKKRLLSEGWEVTEIDNDQRHKMFGTPSKDFGGVDIRDQESVEEVFKLKKFDAIIHAAAQPSHDYATDHVIEDFEINTRGTLNLLEATRKYCPNAVFVYVSSDKVYGANMDLPHNPYDETLGLDFAGVRSFFGCSKTAADIYVQEYGHRFGMKTACFRPGCITGKNHEGAEQHGFLAYLAKCIKEGKTYKIFGDGKTVRDQIHADDVASAFYEFICNPTEEPAVYNIGGGVSRAVSILEAIDLIEKETGNKCIYEFHEERLGDRQWDVHNISRFRSDYPHWNYQYSLKNIIQDVCAK